MIKADQWSCLAISAVLSVMAAADLPCFAQSAAPQQPRRRLTIETGWDAPSTASLRANLAAIEARPFDGVVLQLLGKDDAAKPVDARPAFDPRPWQRAWFQGAVDDLKAAHSRHLTENYLTLGANPGSVDWFDDAGWAAIVEHWRIGAWVAREGGCRGILFDPEAYNPPFSQFKYPAQPQHDKHTFQEYAAKARQRGREVMAAAGAVYPDMTLFCYFMNCVNGPAATAAIEQGDAARALSGEPYGLYPAFIDGWLDAVPPSLTIVDGCENAYLFNSRLQFLEAANFIRNDAQWLVSPANRAKYRAQVQVSFGIYLDAYSNPKGSPWYIDGAGMTRGERMKQNVIDALQVGDGAVWVYGEKFRWWPTPATNINAQSWNEAIPGCEAALNMARNPAEYARQRIAAMRKAGTLVNLLRNGDFSAQTLPPAAAPAPAPRDVTPGAEKWQPGGPPVGWATWQDEKSTGKFEWDRHDSAAPKGSAKLSGVASGCFLQAITAKPGEHYFVEAKCRQAAHGQPWLRVRWQTPDGKWHADTQDVLVWIQCPPGSDRWAGVSTVVQVPQGAGKLLVLLGVNDQATGQDAAWFDDVHVFRLDE